MVQARTRCHWRGRQERALLQIQSAVAHKPSAERHSAVQFYNAMIESLLRDDAALSLMLAGCQPCLPKHTSATLTCTAATIRAPHRRATRLHARICSVRSTRAKGPKLAVCADAHATTRETFQVSTAQPSGPPIHRAAFGAARARARACVCVRACVHSHSRLRVPCACV